MFNARNFLSAIVGIAAAVSAAALDIRINIGTTGPEGNWTNIINSVDTFPAIDFATGADTGITVAGLFPSVGSATGTGAVVEDWVNDIALSSHGGTNFGSAGLIVRNVPAGTYRVEVVASREFDVYGGIFTVNTRTADTTFRGLTPPAVWKENTDGRNPLDWQIWSNVTVGDDGRLNINAELSGHSWVGMNAVRITGEGSGGSDGGGSGDGNGDGGNDGGSGSDSVSAMSNLSVRSVAGAGENTLVVGYAIAGGNKSILVRGIGPTLENYDVNGAVTDARLRMFDSAQTQLASNTNWGGDAAIADAARSVGAFALDATSLDAALLSTNGPGAYSVHVESGSGGAGVALAEIYDTDFGTGGYLSNVSARAGVGTGESVLIVGLVVSGDEPVSVLIRGVGPTLTSYGLTGVLADPELKLFRQGETDPIETNDNWGGGAALSSAFPTVGAFDLTAPDSTDAAMLVELPAGIYSAQVSGVGDSTGVALVELYIMP